jgi:hypothetical protein
MRNKIAQTTRPEKDPAVGKRSSIGGAPKSSMTRGIYKEGWK